MKRTFFFPLVLAVICSTALAQQQDSPVAVTIHPQKITAPELKHRLLPGASELAPGNAAQIYLLAFGRRVEGLGFPEFNRMVEAPDNEFPLDKARELVTQANAWAALTDLQLAARRQWCVWDLTDREQGFNSHAFNLLDSSAQWYGGLIYLSARVAIADGRFDAASSDLQTGFAMSRNLADGAPLSQSMAALYVHNLMCAGVFRWAQRPDAPNLYWPLLNLPSRYSTLRAAVDNESAMLERSFPGLDRAQRLSAEESRDIVRRISMEIARHDEVQTILEMMRDYPRAKREVVHSGLLSSQAAEAIPANSLMLMWYYDQYSRALNSLTKYLALHPWQAEPRSREVLNTIMDADRPFNPLISMLPHYPDAILRFAQADRRVAMLATLEALRNYAAEHQNTLPDSLDQLSPQTPAPIDPITGKPFGYQKTSAGATLSAPAPENPRTVNARIWNITIAH
jgi:hypothetical protein